MLPARDAELVQIVDAALADAAFRAQKQDGTSWLACRPGCTPCCNGVFKISALDAERLLAEWKRVALTSPSAASGIRRRAEEFIAQLNARFPGDPASGLLSGDEEAWDAFANLPEADAPCPALDPGSGRCQLYAGRPLTCRVFGPPLRSSNGIGLCELCYVGADEQTILAGQMHLTYGALEEDLDQTMPRGETVIAWVLAR